MTNIHTVPVLIYNYYVMSGNVILTERKFSSKGTTVHLVIIYLQLYIYRYPLSSEIGDWNLKVQD